jgi:hypothetical protein
MLAPTYVQIIGAILFAVAIIHTFSTKFFERLAHTRPSHAGLWHLLGEVEVVFGFWALVLMLAIFGLEGSAAATSYIDSRNFTEPMFVFAIMVIAGTKPIIQAAMSAVKIIANVLPLPGSLGLYIVVMITVPLLGSFITEPAAMTLAALIIADCFFSRKVSTRFKYASLGLLFVNVSIGGTLTAFAAPPVLMVAGKWGWDINFMMTTIGWKAAIAICISTVMMATVFRKELCNLPRLGQKDDQNEEQNKKQNEEQTKIPIILTIVHFLFLIGVVAFAHHPAIFMGLFLFFLGITQAYQQFQDRLILREGLLVAFFLAGLVVLGGQQQWWLQAVLLSMSSDQVFYGATILTAVTDNAALTYLGSLVDGLSDSFKYALVTGAVTGGGLTIIANAPNPAGFSILKGFFKDEAIHPMGLFVAALGPTIIAAAAFRLL